MILEDKEDISSEQAYILEEMVDYFKHQKSGVKRFEQMNKEWQRLVDGIISRKKFSKSSSEIENTISSWHQEERDICLLLSRGIKKHVDIVLPSKYKNNPELRFREACDSLVASHELRSRFRVPDAASDIEVKANLKGRTISCSMKLKAPGDKKQARASINWLLKQLQSAEDRNVRILAMWPGKTPSSNEPLSEVRANPKCLDIGRSGATPTSFEVRMTKDLLGRFSKPRIFIQDLEEFVPEFYEQIGEHLRRWIPSPPPIDKHDPIEETPPQKTAEEKSGHGTQQLERNQTYNLQQTNDTNLSTTEHP